MDELGFLKMYKIWLIDATEKEVDQSVKKLEIILSHAYAKLLEFRSVRDKDSAAEIYALLHEREMEK